MLLLNAMDWEYLQDYATGAPGVDQKRPYGNSNVAADVAEIIGFIGSGEEGCLTSSEREQMLQFHHDTIYALRAVLQFATENIPLGYYHVQERSKW